MAVSDGPDGVVAWLGTDDVGRAQFPDADVVDLDGGFVTPAFVDSHVHVTATGLAARRPRPARRRRRAAHVLRLVADYARAHPDGPDLGARLGRVRAGRERTPADHRRPRRRCSATGPPTWRGSTCTPRWRPPRCAGWCPAWRRAAGLPRPAAADRRRPPPGARRRPGPADARAAARGPAWPRSTCAARSGIVAVHECAGPDIGGIDDWRELRALDHGVEVVGYWGEAVTSADEARELIDDTGARGLAGDLFVDGALGSHTAWLHEPYADAPDCVRQRLPRRRRRRGAPRAHAPRRGSPRASTSSATPRSPPWSTRSPAWSTRFGAPAVARCGHRLEHLEMVDRRAGGPARRLGRDRQRATELRRAVGRRATACTRSGWAPSGPSAQPVRAVSIPRRATRLRFRYAPSPA